VPTAIHSLSSRNGACLLALALAAACGPSSGSSGNASSTGSASGGSGSASGASAGGDAATSGDTTSDDATPGDDAASGASSGTTTPPPLGDAGTGGPQSVLQRGNDVYRRATFIEPGLTATTAATMAADTTFDNNATFSGNGNTENQGTGSVLYLEGGPAAAGCPAGATGCKAMSRAAGAGLFFAFPALGSNPNVVAFDETTGMPVWTAHVMTGGDGIRGTPVIDEASRRLFVVTGNNPHLVHALSVDTGVEVTTGGWPVTLSKATVSSGGTTFDSGAENQHGATLLVNGILYIPFGGPYGDGGTYLGWIVAVDTTNPTRIGGWATESSRSGIWGSGGLASDGTYVFGATGDTTTNATAHDGLDSEEMVRVTGLAQFTRDEASVFVADQWRSWDKPTADLDFGASTPAYVPLPGGSKPPGLLVAPAKAGTLFILNGADLSAGTYPTPGGELAELTVAGTGGETVYTAPTIYTSASGLHATINVGSGAAATCPKGTATANAMIVSTLLTPGKKPLATEVWCAPAGGGGHLNYPPISTTTDGVSANALVWFVNGSQLSAVDGDTGAKVVTTTGTGCGQVPSMSFPIAVKNRIVVSALGHLCSWSPKGAL
jgi:hypothetical protein